MSASSFDALVGNWYRRLDKGQEFQVVAIEDDGQTIELQRFDGDLEVVELDDWLELELEMIEPPEDWTGPVDDLQPDDLGYSETHMQREDWLSAAAEHRPCREPWELSEDELAADDEAPPPD